MITAMDFGDLLRANGNEWLGFLISLSAKGLILLLIAFGVSRALRNASASARHLVWGLAFASLLALPLLAFGLPSFEAPILPSGLAPAQTIGAAAASASETPAMTPARSLAPEPAAQSKRDLPAAVASRVFSSAGLRPAMIVEYGETASAAKAEAFGMAQWALIMWMTGALLIFLNTLIGTARVHWMARRAERVRDEDWVGIADRLARRVGLARRATLLKSDSVSMPMTFGALKSSVLLPADANDWSDERREVVLLHELAHVKRRDCFTQLLAQLACALYWFNPLIWAAARHLRIERERACDDQVLDAGAKASDYADHLLNIARQFESSKRSSLAAVAIARRSQLEGRLLAILDPGIRRRGLGRIGSAMVGLALALIVLPLASLRPLAQAQAHHTERANGMPAVAIASADRNFNNETMEQIAPMVAAKPIEGSETAVIAEPPPPLDPPPAETPTASAEQQPKPEPAETPASAQEKDSAVSALNEALKDEDPEVRAQALFALSQIGGPRATEGLIAGLKDANPQIRERSAWALGIQPSAAAIDPLVGALKDSSPQVREQAAWALGLQGDNRAIEPLITALSDENIIVRGKAAWALGLRGDGRAVEPLINALKDSSSQVREMAAWALGLKGDKSAMRALSAAMKDTNKEVRGKATWALGMLLLRNGESAEADFDRDIDEDVDVDVDSERSGSGSGVGVGAGSGKGSGSGKGISARKKKSRP